MALRAEERRDKLRKAAVRSKYPMTRRYLNGETRLSKPQSSIRQYITYGGEPGELKHLSTRRKRKKFIDFQSSGERNGKRPNRCACTTGYGLRYGSVEDSRRVWEVPPERVKASYLKAEDSGSIRSTTRHEKPCGKSGGPPPKAKYYLVTDSA